MEKQERAHYFSSAELDLLLKSYEEEKGVFASKSNTFRASRERKEAWQRIAESINVASGSSCRRTWQQVKNKYKNIIQTARRRGAVMKKGDGTALAAAPAEETAQHQNTRSQEANVPVGTCVDTLPGDGSSYISMTGLPVLVLNMPKSEQGSPSRDATTCQSDASLEEDVKPRSSEDMWRGSRAKDSVEDVRMLYCRYLQKEMENRDQEMAYRALKMRKLEKEILLLDKQLE